MDDDPHKAGLYRWQRQNKPVIQSRAHRVKSSDDIQDWIKKVEQASDKATDAAFGVVDTGKKRGKALAQTHTRQARVEEEAHSEAQELLRQWVTDKVHFDADDGFDDLEAWRKARNLRKEKESIQESKYSRARTRRTEGEEDGDDVETAADVLNNIKLVDDEDNDWEIDEAAIYQRVKQAALGDTDPYEHLYDLDEDEAVSSVLKTLMAKNVVKDAFKKDIGDDTTTNRPDPRTKMEMRHQMVKENREKRRKEEEKRLKDRQMKKEATLKAQQMINKEQKDKEAIARREEEEIKREMLSLRKEMAMENRRKEDKTRREREGKEEMERLAREELDREKFEEERMQLQARRMESERRKQQIIKHDLWKMKQESKNLKILHTHFNAWYDYVLSRRLLLAKVKAMSDWKVTVRVWGAWKAYVRGQRAKVASVQYEKEVIESHRKSLAAETHYQHGLVRKCLNAWKFLAREEVERREMEEEKAKTKNKMMSLLNAVAEGRIAGEKSSSSSKSDIIKTASGGLVETDRSNRSNNSRDTRIDNRVHSNNNHHHHHHHPHHHHGHDYHNGSRNPKHRVQAWVDDGFDDDDYDDIDKNNYDVTGDQSERSEFTNVTKNTNNTSNRNHHHHHKFSRPQSVSASAMHSGRQNNKASSKSSNISTRPSSAMSSTMTNTIMNSNSTTTSTTNKGRKAIPTEAWQVMKKHTHQLDTEDIRNLGHGQGHEQYGDGDNFGEDEEEEDQQNFTDAQIRRRFGTQPWMNRHYVVNQFEHRYTAQQKALRQQQEEIKEQKRLIQDLQYKQQQTSLKQQLALGVASPAPPYPAQEVQQKALRQQQDQIREQKRPIQDLQYKQHEQQSSLQQQLASGVVFLAPPGPVQAPPKGNEIPRDTNDADVAAVGAGGNGGGAVGVAGGGGGGGSRIVVHSGSTTTTLSNGKPSVVGGNEEDGQITDRSGLTTQRTATDVSKVSSTPSHNSKYLQTLKNMEERSAHRARMKVEREEKKRRQEEEKLAELEKVEAERLREEEEEKRKRVEAFRLKKRLEKQKEEERHRELARQQEMLAKAKAHYEKSIMKYRGLLPLKKLISLSKRNWNKAVKYHNRLLMKQSLREWREFTKSETERKNKMADEMGQFLLVKHCFERWRKHKYHTAFLLSRADRHYESSLRYKVFYAWREWKDLEHVEREARMDQAGQYYWDHLLRSRFLAWRLLPEKQRREEERQKRKREMRQRVAELIPDYAPRQSVDKEVEILVLRRRGVIINGHPPFLTLLNYAQDQCYIRWTEYTEGGKCGRIAFDVAASCGLPHPTPHRSAKSKNWLFF